MGLGKKIKKKKKERKQKAFYMQILQNSTFTPEQGHYVDCWHEQQQTQQPSWSKNKPFEAEDGWSSSGDTSEGRGIILLVGSPWLKTLQAQGLTHWALVAQVPWKFG